MGGIDEIELGKSIEWLKTQVQEYEDLRKRLFDILPKHNKDSYYPDDVIGFIEQLQKQSRVLSLLCSIYSEATYKKAIGIVKELAVQENLTEIQLDYLVMLTDSIIQYEADHFDVEIKD